MYKIGFLYPSGAGGGGTVPLPTPDWPNNTTLNTVTSGSTAAGIQVTWPTAELTITLRIVSTNVVVSPAPTGNTNFFRIAIGNSSTLGATPFTTYTSNDFNITVAKGQYVWFRLGPAGVSRTVSVYNASNGDTFLDSFTLVAGPIITPAYVPFVFTRRQVFTTPPNVYKYWYNSIQTIQVSSVPTTTTLSLSWSLDVGTQLPKLYYYVNYPGVTTTGSTFISALNPSSPINYDFNTPAGEGFTEYIQGTSSITVSSNDFITFVAFYDGPYISSTSRASATIQSNIGAVVALMTIGVAD